MIYPAFDLAIDKLTEFQGVKPFINLENLPTCGSFLSAQRDHHLVAPERRGSVQGRIVSRHAPVTLMLQPARLEPSGHVVTILSGVTKTGTVISIYDVPRLPPRKLVEEPAETRARHTVERLAYHGLGNSIGAVLQDNAMDNFQDRRATEYRASAYNDRQGYRAQPRREASR